MSSGSSQKAHYVDIMATLTSWVEEVWRLTQQEWAVTDVNLIISETLYDVNRILTCIHDSWIWEHIKHDFVNVITITLGFLDLGMFDTRTIVSMFLSTCDHLTWVLLMRSEEYQWMFENQWSNKKWYQLNNGYIDRIFFPKISEGFTIERNDWAISEGLQVWFPPMILLVVLEEMRKNSMKFRANKLHVETHSEGENFYIDISDNGKWVTRSLAQEIENDAQVLFKSGVSWSGSSWLWLAGLPEIFQRYGAEITATVSEEGTKIKWNRKLLFHIRIPLIRSSSSLFPSSPPADPGMPA